MQKPKCMEKYMHHFTIVVAVPIQDHILFAIDHSNFRWTKVITFVGPRYNLNVVFLSCPRPKTNIVCVFLLLFESILFICSSKKIKSCQRRRVKNLFQLHRKRCLFSAASSNKDTIYGAAKTIFRSFYFCDWFSVFLTILLETSTYISYAFDSWFLFTLCWHIH